MRTTIDLVAELVARRSDLSLVYSEGKFSLVLDRSPLFAQNHISHILNDRDVEHLYSWHKRAENDVNVTAEHADFYFIIEKYATWPTRLVYNELDWDILDSIDISIDNSEDADRFKSYYVDKAAFVPITEWRAQAEAMLDKHRYCMGNSHRLMKALHNKRVQMPVKIIEDSPMADWEKQYAYICVKNTDAGVQEVKMPRPYLSTISSLRDFSGR